MIDKADARWMRAALSLARRGLGRVAPNPAVGCLIIKNDMVIGRGWTQPGGRPHAETQALFQADSAAKGATAYVTLEPCAHIGKTPPCADALVKAGVARVVVALGDPDPRVSGRGIETLKQAGIETRIGVLADEARQLNAGFLSRIERGRPYVTAKIAATLDSRVATRSGESQWITGDAARAHGHLERAQTDAILIGAGTWRADKPALTCRLPGLNERSPQRVVMAGRTPLDDLDDDIWVYSPEEGEALPSPGRILKSLAERGIGRLLIEGGPAIITAFLEAGLIDRLVSYRAGIVFGADGKAAIGPLKIDAIAAAPRFILAERRALGQDSVEIFERVQE